MQTKTLLTKLLRNDHLRQQVWAFPVRSECAHDVLFPCVNPDIMFLGRTNLYHTLQSKIKFAASDIRVSPIFCTSLLQKQFNSENISSKLIPQGIFSRVPTKLFTRKAVEEILEFEGIGWAGQPTVKRIHTVFPEECGDVCDIFKAMKKCQTISEIDTNFDTKVRNIGKSHEIISVKNQNADELINKSVAIIEEPQKCVLNKSVAIIEKPQTRLLHKKDDKIYCKLSSVVEKHAKRRKQKKRTVVIVPKPGYPKKPTRKIRKKKLATNANIRIDSGPEAMMQTNLILNRRASAQPISKYYLHTGSQFRTYSTKVAEKMEKENSAIKESSADDCVCPVILYNIGKKKTTKICGTSSGEEEKKKSSRWKPKMCRLESMERIRNRTTVCMSEFERQGGRRKKDLPKCPKIEKKDIPRVQICLPQLEDPLEKKLKKKCEKIVEEVKTRKRTIVCRPIVVFATEEKLAVTEKKSICTSTKVSKIKSRHTKVCLPPPKQK